MRPATILLLAAIAAAPPAGAQTQPAAPAAAPPVTTSTGNVTTTGTIGAISPFLRSVPSGTPTAEPLKLTVIDAIVRALDHNLGVLSAEDALSRARGTRWETLGDLLPNVSARLSETRQKLNLAAFGFGRGNIGGSAFADIPAVVGPFNVFDARLLVSQTVFDLQATNSAREDSHLVEAAKLSHRSARDFVVHVAGNLFIQALAASARAEAAVAQLETASTLLRQAQDLKQGGIVAGIDVLRAQVQASAQQQRATAAANDFEKLKLNLARVIGLPLGQAFTLDPMLPELPTPDLNLERAVERAYASRPDYQAALERVKAAEAARAAVVGGNLPSVRVTADVGEIGLTPADARTTYSLAGAVNVPIFNGNRTHGKLGQADADLRSRRSEADDLKAGIYYEVRGAFLDLQATAEQLRVATAARDLAAQQLTQSRDRFAAGVASNIEIVQAQDAVALATEQFISAQYGYDLAKGALIRGVGTTEDLMRLIVGGSR